MTEVKAADLPDGSIIATRYEAFIKDWPRHDMPWTGTTNGAVPDWYIDTALEKRGAQVLREGPE